MLCWRGVLSIRIWVKEKYWHWFIIHISIFNVAWVTPLNSYMYLNKSANESTTKTFFFYIFYQVAERAMLTRPFSRSIVLQGSKSDPVLVVTQLSWLEVSTLLRPEPFFFYQKMLSKNTKTGITFFLIAKVALGVKTHLCDIFSMLVFYLIIIKYF